MPIPASLSSLKNRIKTHPVALVVILVVALGVSGYGLKYLEEDAQRQKDLKAKDRSALSVINPFLAPPSPTPTPQLSREYVYAGSRLLAVEDANASAVPPADLAVWRPSTGVWWVLGGPGSAHVAYSWGNNAENDETVPGDYDGDGKTDFSIYRPGESSSWWIIRSSDGTVNVQGWGDNVNSDDIPIAADYDGDGKTDRAVIRPDEAPSNQYRWYILKSSGGGATVVDWGDDTQGDYFAPADYDGDGMADIAIWRSTTQTFYTLPSSNLSAPFSVFMNASSTTPVSADYDGDGKANFAIRSGAAWIIMNAALSSTTITTPANPSDLSTDIPVQNDYDGDGKCDIAVWRPFNSGPTDVGNWYIRKSGSSGALRQEQWGTTGDIPVPAYYRR